ncbi:TPA: hypothetical protein ACKJ9V_002177, partial [Neisseria gonorrhoeae]
KSGQGGEPQTVQIVRQGEATPYRFKFNPLYMAGGVYLGGKIISPIYHSSQEFSGEPIIYAETNIILCPAEKFLTLKRVFHNGNIFNMNQIITFLSNKQGGVRFDKNYDKYKTWQVAIEKAANFLKLGNPYNEDKLSLSEE